jgi:hypothetical protein
MAENRIPSVAWITEQIVEFLSTRFRLPKSLFQPATNLRAAANLDQNSMQALASTLTYLPFMRAYGARITASDIFRVQTVADLAQIIRNSLVPKARPKKTRKARTARLMRRNGGGRKGGGGKARTARRIVLDRLVFAPVPGQPGKVARYEWSPNDNTYVARIVDARQVRIRGRRRAPPLPVRRSHPSPLAAAIPRRPPRYANAVLLEQASGRRIDQHLSLNPGQTVRLRLDIGKLSPESQVRGAQPIPEDKLPEDIDIDLDVMVSSSDFGVAANISVLEAAPTPRIATGRFTLPPDGSPATTPDGGKYLTVYLKVPAGTKGGRALHTRIGYYYRNILVQSQQLTAHVGEPGGFTFVTDFTVSADLTGLSKIPERPRISVLTNVNADGSHQIVLRHPGQPREAKDPYATIAVRSDTIGTTVSALRNALKSRAPTKVVRSPAELAEDLRQLAPIGRRLYDQLPGQKEFAFFVDLYLHPEAYVVQVARPTTSGFVFPWSFIYEIPLTSGVKPTLCPLVAKWDGKLPLVKDAPRQCPHGPHRNDVLCPFGFWGFRYAIEQVASSDKLVTEIPASANCQCVAGETQYQVDLKLLNDHIATLRASLTKALPHATLREGKDRATIERLLGNDLPFVYFFCHGNKLNVADPNPWLAVGNNEPITTGDIIAWPQIWYNDLKKVFWNDVRPLIFINACHSLAIEPETLVTYLDAFVGAGHAAGVIGTEIKVSQPLAMDIAERFFDSWLSEGRTVEATLRAIRMDYLKHGNLFGLAYTPYCWSELQIKKQSDLAAVEPQV